MELEKEILSDITVHMKYAKYLPELERRESWSEIVDRNKAMHIKKFPELKEQIDEAYKYVYDKKVLPSMRSMQFGGKPIEVGPNRGYNCAYVPMDHIAAFSETMFLLLGGTGVGFSVQRHHVEKLPEVRKPNPKRTKRYLIGDSIEGWADAVKMLVTSYFKGTSKVRFDFSDIRPKGARLITSGGKAPGPQPLKECLVKVQGVFDSKENGDKLTPIEVHDIICHIADAVLAGGIRRAALISFFSADDDDMIAAKTGSWWEKNPQRGRANNSVVLMRHRLTKDFFDGLWERVKASNSGEPGFYLTNDKDHLSNPCVTADTWVMTSEGPRQVSQLLDAPFKAVVNGKEYDSTAFWSTGFKNVLRIKTSRGYELKLTDNHEVKIKDDGETRWIPAGELVPGDSIIINDHREFSGWDGEGTQEEGWLVGSVLGDGGHNPDKYHSYVRFWGDSAEIMSNMADNFVRTLPYKVRADYKGAQKLNEHNNSIQIQTAGLTKLCDRFLSDSKSITNKVELASSDFYQGFLKGLFDADGTVQGTQTKGVSVRLSQSNLSSLKIVQRMLSRLGIASSIYQNRKAEGFYSMPDGKGGLKEYYCQATHELVISRENIDRYAEIISFVEPEKKKKLEVFLSERVRAPYRDKWTSEVVSIEGIGKEEVFDCTVDTVHEFDANGLSVHNCCEIGLRPTQFCNLTDTNVSDVTTQEELEARVRAAAFIGTLQASYTDFHYLRDVWRRNTEKDALLGVSMTGIASGGVLDLDMVAAAEVVKKENKRVADLIGIKPAARTTCVKPAGTTSLVLGTSSGIHAWHSPYYIRRLRVGKNEPIYTYLAVNHPELVQDEYFRPHDTAVIEVPQKAPEGAITRSESALQLLKRVKEVSDTWVKAGHRKGQNTHNVSATISIKDSEWADVGDWMWENRASYNGLSVLPHDNGTYFQTPFEECSKERYEKLVEKLHEVDLTKVIELDDNTDLTGEVACGGGQCEIF